MFGKRKHYNPGNVVLLLLKGSIVSDTVVSFTLFDRGKSRIIIFSLYLKTV